MHQETPNHTGLQRLVAGLIVLLLGSAPLLAGETTGRALPFALTVPLYGTAAGSLVARVEVGDTEAEFLVDTGASMVTLERELLQKLRDSARVTRVRKVAARLANGAMQVLDVYLVDRFVLGENCDLGPVEVAVPPRGGRNLLGMNALHQAAPFGLSIEPPLLGLSRCAANSRLAVLSR